MKSKAREYSSPACTLHEFEPGVYIKRVYDAPAPTDGFRVLVDRLWPRGLTKKKAALDLWARDMAPSGALRKWFAHDPERYPEFRRRYRVELRAHAEDLAALRERARQDELAFADIGQPRHWQTDAEIGGRISRSHQQADMRIGEMQIALDRRQAGREAQAKDVGEHRQCATGGEHLVTHLRRLRQCDIKRH